MTRGYYELPGPKKVRVLAVHCSERVRIRWTLPDGTIYNEEHTCPPPEVIRAMQQKATDEGSSSSNMESR